MATELHGPSNAENPVVRIERFYGGTRFGMCFRFTNLEDGSHSDLTEKQLMDIANVKQHYDPAVQFARRGTEQFHVTN